MNWQEVCEDHNLQNLPYKIELNEKGKIEMSPAKNIHGMLQGMIGHLLLSHLYSGRMITECAIATSKGTKVADVAWASLDVWEIIKDEFESSVCPEICVEVVSDSNTDKEMKEKCQLYFEKGAKEIWICDRDGNMEFYDSSGKIDQSVIVPDFPGVIET